MTHERSYKLRWLHITGPAVVFVLFYIYFTGPMLADATGIEAFDSLEIVVPGVVYFWTGSEHAWREAHPPWSYEIMGFELAGARQYWGLKYDPPGWYVSTICLVMVFYVGLVAAARFFLHSLTRRDELPARRSLSWKALNVCAAAWAALLTAITCQMLHHMSLYEKYLLVEDVRFVPRATAAPPSLMASMLPFIILYVIAFIASVIALHIQQKRAAQFWQLERLTFWLVAVSMGVIFWGLGSHFMDDQASWPRTRTPVINVTFLATSVLLWAWTCRVILLFSFARYTHAAREHPDTSCFACGYDLRGSQHSASCPECGAAVVAKPQTGARSHG